MAALEWNTNLHLLPFAHQAQAGPRLVQNSSARNRLSFFLLFSNARTDPLWTHRCSSKIRSARCRFRTEIASTKLVTVNSRRTVHEETRLERIEKFSRWILVKNLVYRGYISTQDAGRRSINYLERPGRDQWWRIDEESLGMATRLGTRNSEVNALEQRGYLIGKKIGQVYSSLH